MRIVDENFKRRRKVKGNATQFAMAGFLICQMGAQNVHYSPLAYVGLILGIGLIVYGFGLYIPVHREEKRESKERKRQEKAELDAANLYLFGTTHPQH